MSTNTKKFSFWVGVCFTLNYIVGSGFLTLPWAFHQTGSILGFLVLAIFALFSVISVFFILETSERAHLIKELDKDIELSNTAYPLTTIRYRSIKDKDSSEEFSYDETQLYQSNTQHNRNVSFSTSAIPIRTFENDRRIEMTELCQLFLGERGKQIFLWVIAIYMYGTLWAYITVFAKAFAIVFSIGIYSYSFYLFIFALIVIPLSLMEFSEQVCVQVTLSIFRIIMMLVMLLTTSIAYFTQTPAFGEYSHHSNDNSNTEDIKYLFAVHFDKLHLLLPLAAYAYIFHHSVTALAEPVADKLSLSKMFTTALLISFVAYTLLGIIISLYFGSHILSSSNLNWEHYVGNKSTAIDTIPYYAQLISMFVILFPALDVASAYPLNAFTLGNNLMSSYYGTEELEIHERSRIKVSIFRLLAAVPPFLGAYIVSDLGHITSFTGLTGFMIAFVVPSLLAYYSTIKMKLLGLNPITIHSSKLWTNIYWQCTLYFAGILLIIIVGTLVICIGYNSRNHEQSGNLE